ncbi:MAG: hypothetical protein AAF747_06945 [Planctomycetota bacterium]
MRSARTTSLLAPLAPLTPLLVAASLATAQQDFAVFEYRGEVLGGSFLNDTPFPNVQDDDVAAVRVTLDTSIIGVDYQDSLFGGLIFEFGQTFDDAIISMELAVAESFADLDAGNFKVQFCSDAPSTFSVNEVTVRTRGPGDPNGNALIQLLAFDTALSWGVKFSLLGWESTPAFNPQGGIVVPTDNSQWRSGTFQVNGGGGFFRCATQSADTTSFTQLPVAVIDACGECLADYNADGQADFYDAVSFIIDADLGVARTDVVAPAGTDGSDVEAFTLSLAAGCGF